jgi:hypothetical protein
MKHGDDQPADGQERERYYIVSGAEMDRIVIPLTLVHASVQLLRRRIANGTLGGPDDLDQALSVMEQATRRMADDVWAVMEATSHEQGNTG